MIVKKLYVARDKDGDLYLYLGGKPVKCYYNGKLERWASGDSDCRISNNMFPDVKWEDEEPTEVTLTKLNK